MRSFNSTSNLAAHNKTSDHIKNLESIEADAKKEVTAEGFLVEDLLSIQMAAGNGVANIKQEIKHDKEEDENSEENLFFPQAEAEIGETVIKQEIEEVID